MNLILFLRVSLSASDLLKSSPTSCEWHYTSSTPLSAFPRAGTRVYSRLALPLGLLPIPYQTATTKARSQGLETSSLGHVTAVVPPLIQARRSSCLSTRAHPPPSLW